jgi:hypothetical protein
MRLISILLPMALAGCSVLEQPTGLMPRSTSAYRDVLTEKDRIRLRDWRTAFAAGLDAARRSGRSADIEREGALLDPDAALSTPAIPNGRYRCRVIKLGGKAPGAPDYASFPGFACEVRGERSLQRLSKLNGPQRYVGLLFPGDAFRLVFLGTLVLGDEQRALQYGQDDQRDVAGYLERIGSARWRLIMPEPYFESRVDIMELVPEGASR